MKLNISISVRLFFSFDRCIFFCTNYATSWSYCLKKNHAGLKNETLTLNKISHTVLCVDGSKDYANDMRSARLGFEGTPFVDMNPACFIRLSVKNDKPVC